MRRIAAEPAGISTVDRSELSTGIRSFHIRHSRNESVEASVLHPVHVIFFRAPQAGVVEIVRVLHERMEPGRHLDRFDDDHP
jgi:toxin ParE1/3/4